MKRRRNLVKTPRAFRMETLEKRLHLAGDLENTKLTEPQATAVLDGLAGLSAMASRFDQSQSFGLPIRGLERDGSPLTLETSVPSQVVDALLVDPLEHWANDLDDPGDTAFWLKQLTSIDGVSADFGTNIEGTLQLDLVWTHEWIVDADTLDLEDALEPQGIRVSVLGGLNLQGEMTVRTTIEVKPLESQPTFRETTFSIDLTGSNPLTHPLRIGLLDSPETVWTMDFGFGLEGQPVDIDKNGEISIDEATSQAEAAFDTELGENEYNIVITPSIEIVGWDPAIQPTITLTGDAVGNDEWNVEVSDFEDLQSFSSVTAEEIVTGFTLAADWISLFQDDSVFEIDVPFVSSLQMNDTIDLGQSWWDQSLSAIVDTDSAIPTFETFDQLASRLGTDWSFDSTNRTVSLPISRFLVTDATEGTLEIPEFSVDAAPYGLADLVTDQVAVINTNGRVTMDFVIDLDPPVPDGLEEAPVSETFAIDNFSLTWQLLNNAPRFTGSARYGAIGFDFDDGGFVGAPLMQASIANPTNAGSASTLTQLYAGLGDSDALLPEGVETSNVTDLRFTGLSVPNDLVEINEAALLRIRTEVGEPIDDARLSKILVSPLDQYAGTSVGQIADALGRSAHRVATLSEAVTDELSDTALKLGQVGEKITTVGDRIVEALVDELDDAIDATADSSIRTIQQLDAWFDNYVTDVDATDIVGQTIQTTTDLVVGAGTNGLEFTLDVVGETVDVLTDVVIDIVKLSQQTENQLLDGVGDLIGASTDLVAELTQQLSIVVELAADDPENVTTTILETSQFGTDLFVNSDGNTSITGSLGALEVELADGQIIIASDTGQPNPAAPVSITVSPVRGEPVPLDASDAVQALEAATVVSKGELDVHFAVHVEGAPTPLNEPFHLCVHDLDTPDETTQLISSPDFANLIDKVDVPESLDILPDATAELLDELARRADAGIFGLSFPIIGDALVGPANFIRDIAESIRDAWSNPTSFDLTDLECAIESAFGGPDPCVIGEEGVFELLSETPDEVLMRFNFQGLLLSESVTLDTDLGLPRLGAELNTTLLVESEYDFQFTLGMNRELGVFLETDSERLHASIAIDLENHSDEPDLQGRLGFLEVDVTKVSDAPIFVADFGIDLTEPSGDDRLTPKEVVEALLDNVIDSSSPLTGVTGGTGSETDRDLRFEVVSTLINGKGSQWLPAIQTDLVINWQFDGSNLTGGDGTSDYAPDVRFENAGIRLGSLLGGVVSEVLSPIDSIFEELEPVFEVLETPVPLISELVPEFTVLDLAEQTVDLYDLISMPNSTLAQQLQRWITMTKIAVQVNNLREAIDSTGDGFIKLGDLSFGNLASGTFDARDVDSVINLAAQALPEGNVKETLSESGVAKEFISVVDEMNTAMEEAEDDGRIEFPIWEDPVSVFGWLLGINEPAIIAWTLPNIDLNIPINLGVTFFKLLNAGLQGSVNVDSHLAVGYDTHGASKFLTTGRVSDFADGFYISDRAEADGTGEDTAELTITADVKLQASAGIDLADVADLDEFGVDTFGLEAGVGGGIEGIIEFDLVDHDNDGRFRGEELFSDDEVCLTIDGQIDVVVEAFYTVGMINQEYPFATERLADFNEQVSCRALRLRGDSATLAELNDGVLTLLVGDRGHERSVLQNIVDENYFVSFDGTDYLIEAFGYEHSIPGDEVTKIVAAAGSGDDTIVMATSINVVTELDGGIGQNTLVGGVNVDFINGGPGDDWIDGRDGDDVITTGGGENIVYGGGGDDEITGGSERDVISGGGDEDTIDGLGGNDVLRGDGGGDDIVGGPGSDFIDGGEGDDVLDGGDDDDTIQGGDDNDEIEGDDGEDYLVGGDGDDTIFGGALSDRIFGESGDDTIDGNSGNDFLFGGDDQDTLHGGNGRDVLDGENGFDELHGENANDELYGGSDDDELFGGEGDDTIYGGTGDDSIYGYLFPPPPGVVENDDDVIHADSGNDFVSGQVGNDVIRGGSGDDLLQGGFDDDEIHGGSGDDTIEGNEGDDELYGDRGNDLIFGDSGQDTVDGGDGYDTIRGGEDDDTLRGGPDDDLILGYLGDDELRGDGGDDILKGFDGRDTLIGGRGNDRLSGQSEHDELRGGIGDDYLEGGGGEDQLQGDSGNDQLFGGGGADELLGGPGDDFILVESTDGETFDAGPGINQVLGPGSDQSDSSTTLPELGTGPERAGDWQPLSGSASHGGVSQVGGQEQSSYSDDEYVFVAWTDFRGNDSEIYVAFHEAGNGTWRELDGSASGGGVSNDETESRRPAITRSGNLLAVAWTEIDGEESTIRTAIYDLINGSLWLRDAYSFGALADHAQIEPFGFDQFLVGWIEEAPSGKQTMQLGSVGLNQCDVFGWTHGPDATLTEHSIRQFDIAVMASPEEHLDETVAVVTSRTEDGTDFIDPFYLTSFLEEYELPCSGSSPPETATRVRTVNAQELDSFSGSALAQPTVGISLVETTGPFETTYNIQVAYQDSDARSNQIVGWHRTFGQVPDTGWVSMESDFDSDSEIDGDSLSKSIGYASRPWLVSGNTVTQLAWRDESVHDDLSGLGSIFVMQGAAADGAVSELRRGDASGFGISETGGVIRDFWISGVPGTVSWTELVEGQPQIYVRTDLAGSRPGETGALQNKLSRWDVNNDGIVSAIDALQVINEVSRGANAQPSGRVIRFFDTNGDGTISPIDALQVINRLASQSNEGEEITQLIGKRQLVSLSHPNREDEDRVISRGLF
ncbi:MAG: dockerin type I domain-containing protein [Planctomycetota bacterium]